MLEKVANYHCIVGENPLWNPDDGRVYWVDIDAGRIFRADHRTLAQADPARQRGRHPSTGDGRAPPGRRAAGQVGMRRSERGGG